ncbi:MAG: EamA family transporter [Rhodoferax sp.]|nr:EamA family transporter [Rhodoferax sp.]
MPRQAVAAAALVLNALVWGVSWWPFRTLQEHGLHPLWATALIYLVALTCMPLARRAGWRGWGRYPLLWLLAVAAGLTNVGFNWAVTIGDVVRAVLLFYMMPAWVVLLGWPLLGERPTRRSLLRLILALTGMVVVIKVPSSPWPVPGSLADWLALAGGFCFALTNVLLRRLGQCPAESRMLAMFGGGTLMASAAALLGMHLGLVGAPPAPSAAWVYLALGVSLAFLAGNLALQYGAARLRASTTSVIMLSEVVFASVSAVLLGAGEWSSRTVVGGCLIVLASLLALMDKSAH